MSFRRNFTMSKPTIQDVACEISGALHALLSDGMVNREQVIANHISKLFPQPADFRERVKLEKRELDERIAKLEAFTKNIKFNELPNDERTRLFKQLSYMCLYSETLEERIANFKP